MKRHAIALLVHPYKDCLLPRKTLEERLNGFVATLLESGASFQNIKFNLVLPGYFLEILDPLLLLRLREMHKRGQMEWLFTGYTEPFLSFSPPWLLNENLKHGINIFGELTGVKPSGFVPPHSNFEPSAIDMLRGAGIQYCVGSRAILPGQYRPYGGYWITEHMGSSIAFFPAHAVAKTAVSPLLDSLETLFSEDPQPSSAARILCIDMLCSLSQSGADVSAGLSQSLQALDRMLLTYQSMRFTEFLSSHGNLGLMHVPSTLVVNREDSEGDPQFLNYLHTYDQTGIIQRKMMDLAENLAARKEAKSFDAVKKTLFFVQDINRYLPSRSSGFLLAADRWWSFSKLIGIEQVLFENDQIKGGHMRITDLLKSGNKTIVMSNKNLSLCIDYASGGQAFEIDYKGRSCNVCTAMGASRHALPMIVEPPLSKAAFADHCLPPESGIADVGKNTFAELGDFVTGVFEYKVKKTETGIKAVLSRNGTLLQADKTCPLSMEKVLGMEKDHPIVSFVYQLSNHSLTPYSFRFAVESTFALPGIGNQTARIIQGKKVHKDLHKKGLSMDQVSEFALDDPFSGVQLRFILPKPVDVWCLPGPSPEGAPEPSNAVTLVMSALVSLEGGKAWTLMGKVMFKKLRRHQDIADEI